MESAVLSATGTVYSMPEFLSPGWIESLHQAASADEELAAATADVDLVVEQHIGEGEDEVVYHLIFDHGRVAVRPGPAETATVRFRQDHETAHAIAIGELSAQRAFMSGRLQVGGDVQALVEHSPALTAFGDTFAAVRAATFADG